MDIHPLYRDGVRSVLLRVAPTVRFAKAGLFVQFVKSQAKPETLARTPPGRRVRSPRTTLARQGGYLSPTARAHRRAPLQRTVVVRPGQPADRFLSRKVWKGAPGHIHHALRVDRTASK
jgi:hypothetical protein